MSHFKLWIDEDMDKSKVYNGNDPTYGYGALAGSATSILNIRRLEIWGLGTKENLEDKNQYWEERYAEIMKRRKVDKTQFMDGSAGLFFGNFFPYFRKNIATSRTGHRLDLET